MSSFYEDASLVMIPSGYKTSKVYCAKPTDGAGDLTFTRSNDTATRVASNGLIEKVRTNLVTYSEQFDNAAWAKTGCTVTANSSTDPIGGTTADKMVSISGNTASKRVEQTFSAVSGTTYTVSAYFKADGWNFAFFNAPEAQFTTREDLFLNLTNGSLSGSTSLGSVESVGNGWYRLRYTRIATASGSTSFRFGFSDTTSISSTGDGTNGVLIWGAQLELSDFGATPYIQTTTAAVSVGPVANVPRLDYLNSSCPRLLLEPQRTNLAQFSESFDNAYWTKTATVTANSTISPTGYQDADTFTDSTTSYLDVRRLIAITPNATHTASFFVKKTTGTITHYAGIAVSLTGGTGRADYGIINTNTGAIVRDASSNVNSAAYSSVDYGDYWRVILTFTDNQSNGNCTFILYPAISSNGTSISSNAQGSNVFWGAQLEAGAYATSYIPTLGASVTRGADSASKTGISSLIGQTEGTLFFEIKDTENFLAYLGVDNLSTGTRILIYGAGDQKVYTQIRNSSTVVFGAQSAAISGAAKAAVSFNSSGSVFYVNGVQVATGSGTTYTNLSQLTFNHSSQVGAILNQALLFKTRLSNSDLAALTTL